MASRGGISIRSGNVRLKSLKRIFRGGVNPTSGSLTAGTRVRIRHSPKNGIRKYAP